MEWLGLERTSIKEVPQSVTGKLEYLHLNGCSKMTEFPVNLEDMKSLVELGLSNTGIKEIPLSIKDMVCLGSLYLSGTPIKALPELPPSLWWLCTQDCASLETATAIINNGRLWHQLNFTNCFKLDQKPLVAAMHLKIQVSL
jgi:Leucine-rich repeat (LRR) protein